jgi:ubiquinone/menaquinone biosynthesis C-methylase UbiE
LNEAGVVSETQRARGIFDALAPKYDRGMDRVDRILLPGGRAWLGAQASGDVLEVGIGTGRNVPYFAPGVRLTGIDISASMLERGRRRADELGRSVELRVADAQALEFPDESFDTVVFCLTLCSIPDDRRAVGEARRVLRPAGRVVLLEHVRSPVLIIRAGQRFLDPLAVRFQADHLVREPADVLHSQRFTIDVLERSRLGIMERVVAHKSQAGPP